MYMDTLAAEPVEDDTGLTNFSHMVWKPFSTTIHAIFSDVGINDPYTRKKNHLGSLPLEYGGKVWIKQI